MKIVKAVDDGEVALPPARGRAQDSEHSRLFATLVADTFTRVPAQRRGHRWLHVEVADDKEFGRVWKAMHHRAKNNGWMLQTRRSGNDLYMQVTKRPEEGAK